MPIAMITPDLYRRAARVPAANGHLPQLDGARIESLTVGGTVLVANDGTILVALRDPDAFVGLSHDALLAGGD